MATICLLWKTFAANLLSPQWIEIRLQIHQCCKSRRDFSSGWHTRVALQKE